jgi:MoaA/NifB/PqqE/SkfB family radical SAM enzyme
MDGLQICPLTNSPCNVEFKDNITKIAFNLLRACNLHCYRCCEGISHKSPKIYTDLYFRFLNESKELNNINTIQLTGVGEPFIYYNKTLEFLKSLKNTNIKSVNIITNATLLNKEKILQLKETSLETNVKYQFTVSMDGFDKISFEKMRCGATFEKVVENVLLLKENFEEILISFTEKEINKDQSSKGDSFCKEHNLTIIKYKDTTR